MKLELKIKDSVSKFLYQTANKMKGDKTLFSAIGSDLTVSTVRRIERTKTAPDGLKWKPSRKLKIIGNKKGMVSDMANTLIGKGDLKDSINYFANDKGVVIGTNRIYGAIHQFGGKAGRNKKVNIVARPYLGVSKKDKSLIEKHLEQHLLKSIKYNDTTNI